MKEKIYTVLEEYGLDKKEVKIYIKLVEEGELNAYKLAKNTGLHRSTVYAVIQRLLNKGFVSEIQKNEKIFYSALEINKIVTKLKDQESMLLSITPELESIKKEGISRVRVFDNKESQKQFSFNLINKLKQGKIKEILILSGGQTQFVSPEKKDTKNDSSQMFIERELIDFAKKTHSRKINIKSIWNPCFKNSDLLKIFQKLGENKFLENIPTLATTVICGEYVAFLFTMSKTPQVIEIQNTFIAEEIKSYFKHLWKIAKK